MLGRRTAYGPTTKKLYETRLNNPRFRHVLGCADGGTASGMATQANI